MSSPGRPNSTGANQLSASNNGNSAQTRGHQHSHSHSGGVPQTAGAGGKPSNIRASVDAARGLATATGLGFGRAPTSPRPASELLNASGNNNNNNSDSPESEAIDKWFEDLQHYQATLEDMAAASLDQNFKEELSAIEQWFRVLSEAERTAALYSLLQSSTPVQIRFFITVLQQMCGDQPNAAMLSPSNPQSAGLEAQMEQKLASMGFKPPSQSPAARSFARRSMGTTNPPNSAGLNPPNTASNNNNNGANDFLSPAAAADHAAATLASQRAKLNKSQSHRVSAPGTLASAFGGGGDMKSPGLWTQNEAPEQHLRRSPSPGGQRPKSTGSELGQSTNNNNNKDNKNPMRTPEPGNFDEQFSPMVGNWSSQVNTPLVPMFADQGPTSPGADVSTANNKLASWGAQHQNANNVASASSNSGPSVVQLDDAKKFRRSGRVEPGSGSGNNLSVSVPASNAPRRSTSGTYGGMPASPGAGSQQAALSAQANWRNNNGLSPNLSASVPSSGLANAGSMTPQELTSALLQQQNMMQAQLQLQQNLLMMNGLMSPNMMMNNNNQQGGGQAAQQPGLMSPGGLMSAGSHQSTWAKTRSPKPDSHRFPGAPSTPGPQGNRTPSSATHHVSGSGASPDETIDQSLLSDVPAWLRTLRLHKYTPNFEKARWEDMIKMDDAALEKAGVSALGARRKLLKVFQNVRISLGMEERKPDDSNQSIELSMDSSQPADMSMPSDISIDVSNASGDEANRSMETAAPHDK